MKKRKADKYNLNYVGRESLRSDLSSKKVGDDNDDIFTRK